MNKSWYVSKTIWGVVIMVIASGLQISGVATISETEQATLIDQILKVASVLGEAFGAALAIYGRIKANG